MSTGVFMGTPWAAVPTLVAVAELCDVDLVVTRPDRPQGRSGRPQPPPVKSEAEAMGLEVVQPEDRAELADLLTRRPRPDVGVVAAFGMILEPKVLALPRTGFLNVHFSLLPRWRGAAPVERAIMAGDTVTGVTLMEMDEGLDTGAVVGASSTAIDPAETGGELTARLAEQGADLVRSTLAAWMGGSLSSSPQPDEGSTYAHPIGAEDRNLDDHMGVDDFTNTVRALAPTPGARLWVGGEPHKVLQARRSTASAERGAWVDAQGAPVLGLEGGAVEIRVIQPPGKRPMPGEAWLRGRSLPD